MNNPIFEGPNIYRIIHITCRLLCALVFGGMIGLEREQKHKQAGFRTYMLVCLGAALTMLLSQYEAVMINTRWADTAHALGVNTDVSRFGAQVINGIGFLGAGTIIVTGRQEVKGLTTAAGLWASACMGLAIGAGFYECVCLGFVMIFIVIKVLPPIEDAVVERGRNMNLYAEFSHVDDVHDIIACIKEQGIQIYDVEIENGSTEGPTMHPHAVFTLRLPKNQPHTQLLSAISELSELYQIEEI